MQTRSGDDNSVWLFCLWQFCLSVCLSVCQTCALWQNGRKICPYFYTIGKTISQVFGEEEWLVGATPSTWNFGSSWPHWSEIANFQSIFAHSASASPKSSINTNRKSTTCFPVSRRWTSYVALKFPKGLQNAKWRFLSKIALFLKKVWYKVSLCENCQEL